MSDKKSYSQRKRDKFDYRSAYFKHNPGLFGCVWKCAYCHRPIVGKSNVTVDHIIPLNSVLGRNARSNLVAACKDCNLKKSDSMDLRVVEGYFSKLLEVIVFSIQKIIMVIVVAIWAMLCNVIGGITGMVTNSFKKLPLCVKALVVLGTIGVLFYLLHIFEWR